MDSNKLLELYAAHMFKNEDKKKYCELFDLGLHVLDKTNHKDEEKEIFTTL